MAKMRDGSMLIVARTNLKSRFTVSLLSAFKGKKVALPEKSGAQNGKKKLAYGESPADALDILRIRLNETEMAELIPDQFIKVNQRELQQYVRELG